MRVHNAHAVAFWVSEGEPPMAALLLLMRRHAFDARALKAPVERIHIVCREIEFRARGLTGKQKDVGVAHLEYRDDAGPHDRLIQTDRLAIERCKASEISSPASLRKLFR